MEHLEGQTLADALVKGPLPAAQVLRYGTEIADALDKAHRQGIVHRDLKPGNIMITKSGAKLLDFGLAKLSGPEGSRAADLSKLATREKPLTGDGTMLGTFQYMAPEQLEGKTVDTRTDIFALGSLLYEMATGHRAFEAKSQASLIVAILEHEPPPMTTLQALAPPTLERLVKVCLAKDPDDRLQTAHDVMQELKWIAEAGSSPGAGGVTTGRGRRREYAGWIAAALLGVALGALGLHRGRPPASDNRVMRLNIAPPEKVTVGTTLAFSPDGRRLAFTGTDAMGKTMVWVRALDAEAATPVAGTEGGGFPFWSPDSRELAFYAGNKLKRVDAAGGSPQTICDAAGDGRGASWNAAGQILFTPDCCSGLFAVPASGGAPRAVTMLDASRREESHRWPRFLPDGRRFLYMVQTAMGASHELGLYVGALDSPERKQLATVLSLATFEAPDRLFYVKEGRLVTSRLDLGRFELAAETTPVAEHVRLDSDVTGLAAFATSARGVVAYRSGGRPLTRLTWFDRAGQEHGFVGEPGEYYLIALSPDDRQVGVTAYDAGAWTGSVWLLDTARGRASRFTFENLDASGRVWSQDASHVLFVGSKSGEVTGLYQKPTTGGGTEEALFREAGAFPDDWSSDGRHVVYEIADPTTHVDLWVLPLFGDRKPRPFLTTPANEAHAKLSRDGRWIAYASDALGRSEVFVQPFPSGPGRWQVSTAGGDEPLWRSDGKELYYVSADRKLMAVALRTAGDRFEAGVPQALFSPPLLPVAITLNFGHYAVSADGQRFLVNKPIEETPPSITVLLNWTPEIKK